MVRERKDRRREREKEKKRKDELEQHSMFHFSTAYFSHVFLL